MPKYGRNFFMAVILVVAACLLIYFAKPSENIETEKETSVTETAATSETEASETEKELSETEKETEEESTEEQEQGEMSPTEYFKNNGYKFYSDTLFIDLDDFSDGVRPLIGLDSKYLDVVTEIEVHNALDADTNFISECKNLKQLLLLDYSGDIHSLAELLKANNIGEVYIRPANYSSADADQLMKEFDGTVQYHMDSSQWLGYEDRPTEGVVFFANLYVSPGQADAKWECQTSEAQVYYPHTWNYHGSLVSTFTNLTEEKQSVKSVQISRDDGGKLTAMPFADGSTSLEIDFEIDPNTNSDFDITEEMFPFSKCETGIYKVVFEVGDEKPEQTFFIDNTVGMSFLTAEQKEIFDKAYDITRWNFGESTYMPPSYIESHTAEDFLAELCEGYTYDYAYSRAAGWGYIDENGNLQERYGDRGGDISYQGHCFVPLYSDNNEVLFKNIVIHGHEDYPYFIWFEEYNYHMVKTDDGWRFDIFQIWH
ncbi:MAG: hypothetical protein J1E40_01355 [Oscillospiraceae bacterium]|nr:hypothetical protein [Oscillospiraceae bacterium]